MSSRKDYVAMAAILKEARTTVASDRILDNLTRRIADMYAYDSAAFDYTKFYEAAGMKVR